MKSWLICLLLTFFVYQERTYTIVEVMRNARQLRDDSTSVKIIGYVTKKLNGNNYQFEDRTAEIQVDIEPAYLPKKPFSDKDAVIIKAQVLYEMNKPITLKVSGPVIND
ncbi:NirD/YgiW/YdeI family stress tolerance protein [Chitinophaga sp. 212800010-3]|jgi:uncharacterized protein YdeI (BOF family)|uniref:NirD/YgiW/YdeI family stress tolerance protein n=1 Tax=unclassified Chitinophaga TaxID=2619133 RepID=UPI002DED8897|nr:BOF domain-containing protein [Chitinophaga sp. 212800010-3]